MENIALQQFISNVLPEEIKNKIFLFAQECILTKNETKRIETFIIGTKRYNTKKDCILDNSLPFRDDEISYKVKNPDITLYKFEVPASVKHHFIRFKKKMTTHLTKKDIAKLRETKYITFENRKAIKKIVDIKHIIREIKSLKYVNEIEISDNPFGLLISIKETIYAYYPPYNNGYSRKYAIYNELHYYIASISPLQMLWRIHRGLVSMIQLRELAKINKIPGRSKLKTKKDYIKAFMKL